MAKTYLSTVKYVIKTDFTIDGIVDKHDIIGAIFGQSEGLIGEEMDLKELQKNGKLGRIEVETQVKSGKTVGTLMIPSSLDRVQTSILAAAIESVDKVGPCNSEFKTGSIEDARKEKRKAVTERAKELLLKMGADMPETQEIAEEIKGQARASGMKEIGRDKIAIGPEVDSSNELILVEGRADVINLVKHGIKNVAGVGGAKISRTIVNLARGKEVTVFVDGDRGGDIIARQLGQALKVDFVARAPDGKEVEELTLKEILAALRKKDVASKSLQAEIPFAQRGGSQRFGERNSRFGERSERNAFPETRERGSFGEKRENTRPDEAGSFGGERERSPFGERRPFGPRNSGFGRDRGPGNRSFGRDFGPRREGFGNRAQNDGFRERREFAPRPVEATAPMPSPGEGEQPKREMPTMRQRDLGAFTQHMKELEGSLKARFLDKEMKAAGEVNVRDLLKEMPKHKAESIVLDGIVTKRLLEEAEKSGVKQLVGVKKGRIEESEKVRVSTLY
jgi:DNA primase